MNNRTLRSLAAAFGASLLATAIVPLTQADTNPFAITELSAGYQVAGEAEGKCGEGKCGGDKAAAEGKCGEGKCGGDKAAAEGECGEGKCGGDKAAAEGKCGEGKCGGDKAKS